MILQRVVNGTLVRYRKGRPAPVVIGWNQQSLNTWFAPGTLYMYPGNRSSITTAASLAGLDAIESVLKLNDSATFNSGDSLNMQRAVIVRDLISKQRARLNGYVTNSSVASVVAQSNSGLSAPSSRPTQKTVAPIPPPPLRLPVTNTPTVKQSVVGQSPKTTAILNNKMVWVAAFIAVVLAIKK